MRNELYNYWAEWRLPASSLGHAVGDHVGIVGLG